MLFIYLFIFASHFATRICCFPTKEEGKIFILVYYHIFQHTKLFFFEAGTSFKFVMEMSKDVSFMYKLGTVKTWVIQKSGHN